MVPDILVKHFDLLAEAPNGVEKLRELILGLAYSGRLVSRDPASQKPQGPVDNSRWCHDWEDSSVGEIAENISPGFACSRRFQKEDGYVHLRTHNVSVNGRLNFDLIVRIDEGKVDSRKASLRKGDVIFNNTNSQELVGKTCLVDEDYDYAFSNHLTLIRLKNHVEPGFLVYYFNLLLRQGYFAALCNRWIGQAGINTKAMAAILVPIPPLAEQKRIVAKVDELMALCDELEARQQERSRVRMQLTTAAHAALTTATTPKQTARHWHRIQTHFDLLYDTPQTVQQLREVILQLAVQGRLVKQDPNDEPAIHTVVRHCTEHRERQPDDGDIAINGSVFESLPYGWTWVTVHNVAEHRLGKMLDRAKNSGQSFPYLRNTNVHWFRFELTSIKEMLLEDVEVEEYLIVPGDVLICEGGHGIARTAVWRGQIARSIMFQKALHRVRPRPSLNSDYLSYCIRVYFDTGILQQYFTGAGIPHFTGKSLAKVAFPLPPRAEQDRIVARTCQLMGICDELESKLAQSQTKACDLIEAVCQILTENQAAVPADAA